MASHGKALKRVYRQNGWILGTSLVIGELRRIFVSRILRSRFPNGISVGRGATLIGSSAMRIGSGFRAGNSLWLQAGVATDEDGDTLKLLIGENVVCSDEVHIAAISRVEIGNSCLFGSKVHITDHSHGSYTGAHASHPAEPPLARPLATKRPTVIGQCVWLGDGVVVAAGVMVGDGCVVGANSVVTRDLPAGTLAVGSPARVIKVFDLEAGTWKSTN